MSRKKILQKAKFKHPCHEIHMRIGILSSFFHERKTQNYIFQDYIAPLCAMCFGGVARVNGDFQSM